jgi:hypothetical protein
VATAKATRFQENDMVLPRNLSSYTTK